MKNAQVMAQTFVDKSYKVISGGTDNHLMLIDLRSKGDVTGRDAENALIKADITINKNMVPYDSRSPFVTSGIRIGTSAITSRGMNENDCVEIVEWIDSVLTHLDNDSYIADIKYKINIPPKDIN